MTPIVHALVGCGRVAPSHVEAFSRIPEVRLKYACDSEPGLAAMFAAKHGIEHAAVSFEHVMADPEVHSISIATPHFLHAPMALAALKSGKHALIEKPFAMTPNDGKTIIATAAERPQIVVLPVSQHRFDPVVRTVAQLVLKGMLGTVLLVRAHLECFRAVEYYTESKWRGKWQTEGGSVLINQAYHIRYDALACRTHKLCFGAYGDQEVPGRNRNGRDGHDQLFFRVRCARRLDNLWGGGR